MVRVVYRWGIYGRNPLTIKELLRKMASEAWLLTNKDDKVVATAYAPDVQRRGDTIIVPLRIWVAHGNKRYDYQGIAMDLLRIGRTRPKGYPLETSTRFRYAREYAEKKLDVARAAEKRLLKWLRKVRPSLFKKPKRR